MKFFIKIFYYLCKIRRYIGIIPINRELTPEKEIALSSNNSYKIVIYGLFEYNFKDKLYRFLKPDYVNVELDNKSVRYWVKTFIKQYTYHALYIIQHKTWTEIEPTK